MFLLLKWALFALVIMLSAWLIPGIEVDGFLSALLVVVVMALINTFVKPVLQIITLPVNILTLGLFTLVINALLFMLAGYITPGFEVEGFLSALIGSVILSLFALGISRI